jgi:GNAT superfamily N-acetyltransferase
LATVESWYADRGLPSRLQLPAPGATAGLRELLTEHGYDWSPPVHVMTAELGHVLRAADARSSGPTAVVRLDEAPDGDWLAAYRRDGGPLPGVAGKILGGHPAVVFASVRVDGEAVAIARAAVDARWVGLSAVEVSPALRRQGLAALVSAAALRWAGTRGARQVYLQTEIHNTPAVALYRSLGFGVHHDSAYANQPSRHDG